jgi:heme A synthase
MYSLLLAIHNVIRWFALILGIAAAVLVWVGWLRKREWRTSDQKIGSYFGIAVDIQFLLGLVLYFFLSPLTQTAMHDFGTAMSVSNLRFFALVHPFYMILALVCAHLGSILPRRTEDSSIKYRRAAIWFTLAVLFILLGMPWNRPLLPGLG